MMNWVGLSLLARRESDGFSIEYQLDMKTSICIDQLHYMFWSLCGLENH